MSLHVFRSALFRLLHLRLNCAVRSSAAKLAVQFSDDGLGKLRLHREYVLQITRVVFRPDLLAGVGASEPGGNAHTSSTRCATPSFCPISWAVAFLPLNENADVRAATCRRGIFCSTVNNSSLMPSEKYSLPLSSLRLANASTATELALTPDLDSAEVRTATDCSVGPRAILPNRQSNPPPIASESARISSSVPVARCAPRSP